MPLAILAILSQPLKGPIKGEGLVYPLPPAYLCLLYIPPTSSYSIPLDNVVLS